jgi:hypothetical protein
LSVEVRETVLAARQSDGLRGPRRASYNAFLDELAARGCAALDYRVTGPPPLSWLCVRHLRGRDRAVVAFENAEVAWVVLVGPHNDNDPGQDVYATLYRLAGIEPPPNQQRTSGVAIPAPVVERCYEQLAVVPRIGLFIDEGTELSLPLHG